MFERLSNRKCAAAKLIVMVSNEGYCCSTHNAAILICTLSPQYSYCCSPTIYCCSTHTVEVLANNQYSPFLRRSSHRSGSAGQQKMGDSRQPFHTPAHPKPTSQRPCCSPETTHYMMSTADRATREYLIRLACLLIVAHSSTMRMYGRKSILLSPATTADSQLYIVR